MSDATSQAAELLLAARRDPTRKLAALPDALKPADRPAAYAIQHAIMQQLGPIGGWKVSPSMPPQCGALPASGIAPSGAKLSKQQLSTRAIESEMAVRMGRDLPPRPTPYTREDIIAAIASMHPVIEVCNSRYIEPKNVDQFSALADTQSHGGLIYGAAITDWKKVDPKSESVEQFVDGKLDASRTGHPAPDLIDQVVWMANEGSVWAGGLKSGQFVTCGSWTGANRIAPVAKVHTKFSTIGDVTFEYVE